MDASFWHQRWADNQIGFHENQPNRLLGRYFDELELPTGSRVFLPLCGKTLDIGWLLSREYRVVGIELNQSAIEALYDNLGITPDISPQGKLTRYSCEGLEVYVGDFFALTTQTLGEIDAVYDRAALVALPDAMRHRYTEHLASITKRAPQLLLSLEYDQRRMHGPPFSVDAEEIRQHYEKQYSVRYLVREPVPGGLKGLLEIDETAWLLRPTRT